MSVDPAARQEAIMDMRGDFKKSVDNQRNEAGAAGLMALVVVLILTVCAAATLLLTLPQSFDGAAAAAAAPRQVSADVSSEPTFHELYPVNPAAGISADVPTF
ncbi:MAG: hypothetical protein ACXWIM_11670 [Burkholderiales bacterium]